VRTRRLLLEPLEDRRLLTLAPELVDLRAASDSGLFDDDDLTNIAEATIDITAAEAGDVIRVYSAGELLGEATQLTGVSYEYEFTAGQLAEGSNTITARAFDGVEESEDSPALVITLDTTGPRIIANAPEAPVNLRTDTLDSVTVTFNEQIDFDPANGTLATDDVTITGPDGAIAPADIMAQGGNDYQVTFAAQTRRGTYAVSLGPDVSDLAGNVMDQDEDGQPGEPEDVFTFGFDAYDADAIFTADTAIPDGDTTYDGQDICINGATVTIDGAHTFNSIQLIEGAVLTHTAESDAGVNLEITTEAIVSASSSIRADGKGYGSNSGPGAGTAASGAGGGGYGGVGGNGVHGAGGSVYGSITEPTGLGSGGGRDTYYGGLGGAGGGAIRLVVDGTFRVDGELRSDGKVGGAYNAGGGSGGSLYLTVGSLAGDGVISADGGGSGPHGGGGGGSGGRIAVYYDTDTFKRSARRFHAHRTKPLRCW